MVCPPTGDGKYIMYILSPRPSLDPPNSDHKFILDKEAIEFT